MFNGPRGSEPVWQQRPLAVLEVELDTHQVAHPDLVWMVHDILVVLQCKPSPVRSCHGPHRHRASPVWQWFGPRRSRPANPFGRIFEDELARRVVVRLIQLHRLPQRHLAQRQKSRASICRDEAVVGALGDHIGEVEALAEHVARHGGLRRGDEQALGQDAHPVRKSATVPEKHVVSKPAAQPVAETLFLATAPHGEDIFHLESVVGVPSCVASGRSDITADQGHHVITRR
mmetsp:Transcript_42132/g.88087  ORF Transcript_42132/g.88087 Transcript_42132/m.88087 type:complete len:231 (+) Transcript_42132:2688-3380(+)